MKNKKSLKTRQIEDGNWCWVDKTIVQNYTQKVRALGIVVYGYLACLVDADQICYPSQQHIAQALGCSRSSICRALGRLEKNGLIAVDKDTSGYPHRYRLLQVGCDSNAR